MKFFLSFKDYLALALKYSREHSLQNTAIHLSKTAHIIHFNTFLQKGNSVTSRHNFAKETPLSVYVAFLLHSQTGSRLLVDKFHDLGMFISYNQMLVLLTQLCMHVCKQLCKQCMHAICI